MDRFFPKLLRYAQTSTTFSKAASKFASEKFLGVSLDHEKQATILRDALGSMKGPIMKVAQFLATVPGALPSEYSDAFMALQSNAPPMGPRFVNRRMTAELGPFWQSRFQTFDPIPSFAASLGQVHKARLLTGEMVACKLQYSEMEHIIDADLTQLKFIFNLYEFFNQSIQTEEIFEEIRDRLFEELDYINEAKNIELYRNIFENYPGIHVPKVYSDYTTERLLTLSWCVGLSVLSFKPAPLEKRNEIASRLFHAWYLPFYHHSVIHGDPHPGNYTISSDGTLNLLDFGCIRHFPVHFIEGVVELYRGLLTNNQSQIIHAYESWGFKNLSRELIEIITLWAKLLYDPLLDDRVRPIQEKIIGWDVASKIHAELHKLGGITPPREFVFMDRAAVGIGSVLFHLGAELNWHRMFEKLIEDFPAKMLKDRS